MIIDWTKKYATLASWSKEELARICCGLNPDEQHLSASDLSGSISEQVDKMFFWQQNLAAAREIIQRAVDCKELVAEYQKRGGNGRYTHYFKRQDAVRWALASGVFPNFPFVAEAAPDPRMEDMPSQSQAIKKASETLKRERAKPQEIAWAWVALLTVEAGMPLVYEGAEYQKRLRAVRAAHEWILSLRLPSTDDIGRPSQISKGVRVAGIDDESLMFVSVANVRDAALADGRLWPSCDSSEKTHEKPLKVTMPELILNTIKELGYQPQALPVGSGTIKGAKAAVYEKIRERFKTKGAFDSHWKTMKANGEIADLARK